jgi:hypothetical protein
MVRKIAEKHHLEVYEPPDEVTISGECRHHFELDHSQEKLVVAHPRYLMIRIAKWPIFPELTMMEDLSALYKNDCCSPDLEADGQDTQTPRKCV